MKVGSNPEANRGAGAAQAAQTKPRGKFSEVLKDKKDGCKSTDSEDFARDSTLINDAPALLASVTPPAPANNGVVNFGQPAAGANSEAMVSSLVREITVQMPQGSAKSVDIQFDSRTLQGLHVRIQKSGDNALNVQFSTASEAVSRLLTNNSRALTEALEQRGYVAPVITVQRPEGAAAFSSGDSRQSSRDRGGRNGKEQGGGGQKRR
jgi:flagellar hook-length control protein FliK